MQAKNRPQVKIEPVQLCLGIGKAQALAAADRKVCQCECDICPPWDHPLDQCIRSCRRSRSIEKLGRL